MLHVHVVSLALPCSFVGYQVLVWTTYHKACICWLFSCFWPSSVCQFVIKLHAVGICPRFDQEVVALQMHNIRLRLKLAWPTVFVMGVLSVLNIKV